MKFTIIGVGNMGGALARGLAKGSLVCASDITVSDPSVQRTEALQKEFPEMKAVHNNKEAVKGADVVLFAVKPWLLEGVIEEVKDVMDYDCDIHSRRRRHSATVQVSGPWRRGISGDILPDS